MSMAYVKLITILYYFFSFDCFSRKYLSLRFFRKKINITCFLDTLYPKLYFYGTCHICFKSHSYIKTYKVVSYHNAKTHILRRYMMHLTKKLPFSILTDLIQYLNDYSSMANINSVTLNENKQGKEGGTLISLKSHTAWIIWLAMKLILIYIYMHNISQQNDTLFWQQF